MNTTIITAENNVTQNQDTNEVVSVVTKKDFCVMWKKISNDKRTKPHLVEHKSYDGTSYKVKEKGWIVPEHHIIYNLIRNLSVSRGFQENTEGYKNALNYIKNFYQHKYVTHLHAPFVEHISLDQFKVLLLELKTILN